MNGEYAGIKCLKNPIIEPIIMRIIGSRQQRIRVLIIIATCRTLSHDSHMKKWKFGYSSLNKWF